MIIRPAVRGARALASRLGGDRRASAAAGASMMSEVEARDNFLGRFQAEESLRERMVYSLSFAGEGSLEKDLESDGSVPLIDERMKRQLRNSYGALLSPSNHGAQKIRSRLPPQLNLGALGALDETIKSKLPPLEEEESPGERVARPLPKTLEDISPDRLDGDPRAIVVTETASPFRVVAVNAAWEDLCGYANEECRGRPLGALLRGPETDWGAAATMLSDLLAGKEAGATLTNYDGRGRRFRNDVRVGPVADETGNTVRFVGVLREVADGVSEDRGEDGRKAQLPFAS